MPHKKDRPDDGDDAGAVLSAGGHHSARKKLIAVDGGVVKLGDERKRKKKKASEDDVMRATFDDVEVVEAGGEGKRGRQKDHKGKAVEMMDAVDAVDASDEVEIEVSPRKRNKRRDKRAATAAEEMEADTTVVTVDENEAKGTAPSNSFRQRKKTAAAASREKENATAAVIADENEAERVEPSNPTKRKNKKNRAAIAATDEEAVAASVTADEGNADGPAPSKSLKQKKKDNAAAATDGEAEMAAVTAGGGETHGLAGRKPSKRERRRAAGAGENIETAGVTSDEVKPNHSAAPKLTKRKHKRAAAEVVGEAEVAVVTADEGETDGPATRKLSKRERRRAAAAAAGEDTETAAVSSDEMELEHPAAPKLTKRKYKRAAAKIDAGAEVAVITADEGEAKGPATAKRTKRKKKTNTATAATTEEETEAALVTADEAETQAEESAASKPVKRKHKRAAAAATTKEETESRPEPEKKVAKPVSQKKKRAAGAADEGFKSRYDHPKIAESDIKKPKSHPKNETPRAEEVVESEKLKSGKKRKRAEPAPVVSEVVPQPAILPPKQAKWERMKEKINKEKAERPWPPEDPEDRQRATKRRKEEIAGAGMRPIASISAAPVSLKKGKGGPPLSKDFLTLLRPQNVKGNLARSGASRDEKPAGASIVFHRCRFFDHMPSAINALAFWIPPALRRGRGNRERGMDGPTRAREVAGIRLACARANGDVEIWNPHRWHLERTIPGVSGSTIESVVWVPGQAAEEEDEADDDNDEDDDESKQRRKPNKANSTPSKKQAETPPPRLITAGLDGYITEWDLTTLSPRYRVESGGGSIWCMAVSPSGSDIAVGCEDGCVRIFTVLGTGSAAATIAYSQTYDRQDGRILSLAYHPNGSRLATGSTDSCVRVYDTATRRLIRRSTVDTVSREETLVWSVAYLGDESGTLVSGDSLGAVTFWGNNGTMTRRLRAHAADVLCLAVGGEPGEEVVFSSGIDRKVVQYRMVEGGAVVGGVAGGSGGGGGRRHGNNMASGRNWIVSGDRRFHSHDVRALALCEVKPIDSIVSGGVDTVLTISTTVSLYPSSKQFRHMPFPQKPLVSLAEGARRVLCRYDNKVKIWALGVASEALELARNMEALGFPEGDEVARKAREAQRTGTRLDVVKVHKLIAEIKVKLYQCATNLVSAAISDDGTLVALSDLECTRLYHIASILADADSTLSKGFTTITRIRSFPSPSQIPGSHQLKFTPDSKRLILAGVDSVVRVVDVSMAFAGMRTEDVRKRKSDDGVGPRSPTTKAGVEIIASFSQHRDGVGISGEGLGDGAMASGTKTQAMFGGKELVCSLAISADGQWLATGDLANRILVFNLDTLKHHVTLPRFKSLHTSISFHPLSPSLTVSLASNELFIYDAEDGRLSDWSRECSGRLPDRFLHRNEIIMGHAATVSRPEIMVVWAGTYLCSVDVTKPIGERDFPLRPGGWTGKRKREAIAAAAVADAASKPAPRPAPPAKVQKRKKKSGGVSESNGVITIDSSDEEVEDVIKPAAPAPQVVAGAPSWTPGHFRDHRPPQSSFQMNHNYGPLMFFGFMGEKEAVAVERPLLSVIDGLPAGYYRKRYGT
ncbi:U3 small nucleolar RNA-associated protein 4 [Irineochytrium annulatum]|nr:U3 small nucleolar RNA-associated protein 4 [Irineochytrium annulatum]